MSLGCDLAYHDFSYYRWLWRLISQNFAGRTATILLLYLGGIAILAQVVAMYFEYRSAIRKYFKRKMEMENEKSHCVS